VNIEQRVPFLLSPSPVQSINVDDHRPPTGVCVWEAATAVDLVDDTLLYLLMQVSDLVEWAIALHGMYESALVFI
jgi:hypothetical protein